MATISRTSPGIMLELSTKQMWSFHVPSQIAVFFQHTAYLHSKNVRAMSVKDPRRRFGWKATHPRSSYQIQQYAVLSVGLDDSVRIFPGVQQVGLINALKTMSTSLYLQTITNTNIRKNVNTVDLWPISDVGPTKNRTVPHRTPY